MIIPEQVPPFPPPVVAPPAPPGRAAPPGSRYDHLARTPGRRWYHAPAGLVAFAAGYVLAVIALSFVVYGVAAATGAPIDDNLTLLDESWAVGYGLLTLAVGLPVLALVVRFVERRRPGALSSVVGRLRWGWLAACLLPAFLLTAGLTLTMHLLFPAEATFVGWPAFLGVAIAALLVTPFQAAAEEYVFRGWLVQKFGAFVRTPWPGVLVSAVLFAMVHEGALSNVWGFADLVVFAVMLSVVTIATGGLEAAIVLHVLHNATSWVYTAAFSTTTAQIADYSGFEPLAVVFGSVPLAVYVAVVVAMARRRRLATRSAG